MSQTAKLPGRVVHFFEKEIWKPESISDRSPKGWVYAFFRVISITWTVFDETNAASRAAALSYSSLLGLGPLVAIAMLVAGFMIDKKDPDLAVDTLNRLIKFVAPQVSQYEQISSAEAQRTGVAQATKAQVNPELVSLINGFVQGSKSGTVGAVGGLSLIFIVLMLFTSVENAFNEIWGVRRGRSWLLRVVFYWTIVTLGAVLFFASLTALGAGAFVNVFVEKLHFGTELITTLRWMLPVGAVALLIGVLTLFYRYVPNTHVFWRAALIGAVVVTALIFLNNLMAFFYFRRVLQDRSLYGSIGIAPILMLGLYIFWLFVLVGGQVSYAVQNVHFRNSKAAWSLLSETMRERLSLVVLLTICRRFQECLDPYTASELGGMVRVPTQIINECLNRLVDMKLITLVPPDPNAPANDYRYQPARPIHRITLQDFKRLDDSLGADPTGTALSRLDPILNHYDRQLDDAIATGLFTTPLDELLAAYPFDQANPPFVA
jgi:membrane protein